MAEKINYYQVLGIPRSASQSEVKNAYRRLAKERHPDHPSGSEEEFSRLQEANAVLSDPERRRRHDEDLDLAHAADQLAGLNLDFGSLDDEVSRKRRDRGRGRGRETGAAAESGPSMGERLRNRFRRGDAPDEPASEGRRGRQRPPARQARWYAPHDLDPEPVTWKTGTLSFLGAFAAFLAVGQIGLWATGANVPPTFAIGATVLGPFMWIFYTLAGLLAAYFAYRAAGWIGLGLVFVAALVVGGSGGPEGLVQFTTVGIAVLLALIFLRNRRDRSAWRGRR
jgi:molecular chaperone DnaJ